MPEGKRKVQAEAIGNSPRFRGGQAYVYNNSNSNAILKGLAKFEPALGRLVKKEFTRSETDKGVETFKSGEAPPRSATDIHMTAYGKLKGEQEAIRTGNGLAAYLAKNPRAEFAEYEAFKAGLVKEHSEGMGGYTLDSYLPNVIEMIGRSDAQFQKAQIDILKDDTAASVSSIAGEGLAVILRKTAPENVALALRNQLTGLQVINKDGVLDRTATAAAHLNAIGRQAEIEGKPEWLDYALIKDGDGVALADTTLAEDVRTFRTRAEEAKKDMDTRNDKKKDEFLSHKKGELTLALHSIISNEDMGERERMEALQALETEYYKYGYDKNNEEGVAFDSSFTAAFGGAIRTARSLEGFNTVDQGTALRRLEELGTDLTLVDVQREVGNITKTTYGKYMNRLAGYDRKQMTGLGREDTKRENSYRTPTMRSLSYANPFGPIFNPYINQGARTLRGLTLWNDKLDERRVGLKDGEYLKSSDYEEIGNEVTKQVNLEIPPMLTTGIPATQTGSPKSGGNLGQQQAGTKPKTAKDKIAAMADPDDEGE